MRAPSHRYHRRLGASFSHNAFDSKIGHGNPLHCGLFPRTTVPVMERTHAAVQRPAHAQDTITTACLDAGVAELDGPGLHIGLECFDLLVPWQGCRCALRPETTQTRLLALCSCSRR